MHIRINHCFRPCLAAQLGKTRENVSFQALCACQVSLGWRLTSHFNCRTVAVECCYQNVGIATSLALTMFEGNDLNHAMGVPFFYGFCEALLVGLYCVGAWKAGWSKAPVDAPMWRILFTTYEVLEAEKQQATSEIEVSLATKSEDSQESADGQIFTTYFQLDHKRSHRPKAPSGGLHLAADQLNSENQQSPESSLI